jgi:hypothetical protein
MTKKTKRLILMGAGGFVLIWLILRKKRGQPLLPAAAGAPALTGSSLFDPIQFGEGSATVASGYASRLSQIAAYMRQHSGHLARIRGYASFTSHLDDPDEARAFNQELSERRAANVASILVDHGVPSDRVDVRGMGQSERGKIVTIEAVPYAVADFTGSGDGNGWLSGVIAKIKDAAARARQSAEWGD